MNPRFIIKKYDPIDEAIQLFHRYNSNPEERQHTEAELTQLVVHRINRFYGDTQNAQ